MKKILLRLWNILIEGSYKTYLIIFSFALIFILIISILNNYFMKHEFIEGIFIESFGMLLDLLIIGALFTYFYNKGERRRTIKRYSEEIDDFRKWNENEATFRIIGNIKRLIKLGIHKIDLSHCYLMNADFTDFNIEGTNFNGANLNNIVIDRPSSNISHVKFWKW